MSSLLPGGRVVTWVRWESVDVIGVVLAFSCRMIIPAIHSMMKICGCNLTLLCESTSDRSNKAEYGLKDRGKRGEAQMYDRIEIMFCT